VPYNSKVAVVGRLDPVCPVSGSQVNTNQTMAIFRGLGADFDDIVALAEGLGRDSFRFVWSIGNRKSASQLESTGAPR